MTVAIGQRQSGLPSSSVWTRRWTPVSPVSTIPHFTIELQAEAPTLLLWRAWPFDHEEVVPLSETLSDPSRAEAWEIDGGEIFEAGFSDSALAADRCYGYILDSWFEDSGPTHGPYAALEGEVDDGELDAATAAFASQRSRCEGSIDGWIVDEQATLAYAEVRHYLRTLQWRTFDQIAEAADELFVRDLRESLRGLTEFDAVLSLASSS